MKPLFGVALSLVLTIAKNFEESQLRCEVSFFNIDTSLCDDSQSSEFYVSNCYDPDITIQKKFIFVQRIGQDSFISFCHLKTILENRLHLQDQHFDYSRLENLYRQESNTENSSYYSLIFTNWLLTIVSQKHLQCSLLLVEPVFYSFMNPRLRVGKIHECGPNNTCCSNLKWLMFRNLDLSAAREILFHAMSSLESLGIFTCFVKVLRLSHLYKLKILMLENSELDYLDLSWLPVYLESLSLRNTTLRTITDTQNRASAFELSVLNIQETDINYMDALALFPSLKRLSADILTLDMHAFSRSSNMTLLHLDKHHLRHVERFSLSSFDNRSSPIVIQVRGDNLFCFCDRPPVDWECSSYRTVIQEITMLKHVEHDSTSLCQYVARCPGYLCKVKKDMFQHNIQSDCKQNNTQWAVSVDCGGLLLRELPLNMLSTWMTHFYLDGNNFTRIDLHRILLASHIKVLFLNGSNINEIETQANNNEDSECYSNELTELYLQKNNLTHIQSKQFQCLTKLKILSLEGNAIASITSNPFKYLTSLREVLLQKNHLRYVESSTFSNLKELQVIHMEENSLQDNSFGDTLDLSNQFRLRTLNLSTNKFRSLPRILMCSNSLASPVNETTSLDSVFFNDNEIRDVIVPWSWLGVQVAEMHLEGNQIEALDKQSLSHLNQVKRLFLNDNNIRFINKNTFEALIYLEHLYLHRNHLVNPRVWEYGLARNLTKLTLDNTSFVCNCEYIEELIANGKAIKPLDVSVLNCISDNTNKQYRINEYFLNACQTPKSLIMSVSITFGAVLFIVLLVALLYRYSFEAKVLLYSQFPSSFLKDPTVDKSKRWDVFVAYSGADLDFIAQQLHPGLGRYHTCLHDRDFVVGAFITDNIIASIGNSCCTLVVLSNAFLQSAWCQYEFKMAHMNDMKDKCRRLFAIVIEDLDMTNVNEEIALYLSSKTYLRWGDRLFWSKLYYALPAGRKRVHNENIPLQDHGHASKL